MSARPAVVYLHGFASSPNSSKARAFHRALDSAGVAVTVPDLAEGDFPNLTVTAQLAALDRAVAGRPVDLIGSSMGGWLAALYASRHSTVRRLVLLAPAFGFNRRWPERVGPADMERWRRTDALAVFHYGENRIRQVRYRLIEDAARYEDFPAVHQPTLIFHGIHDDIVPVGYSEEFAAAHPNARLEVPDSGHDLLNVLDRIVSESLAFLAG